MTKVLNYEKVRDVESPKRGSNEAAGIDIYVPAFDDKMREYFKEKLNSGVYDDICDEYDDKGEEAITWLCMLVYANRNADFDINEYWDAIVSEPGVTFVDLSRLSAGTQLFFPCGLKFDIPSGMFLKVDNRSSVASKMGLTVGADIIDSDYTGEVHINLHASANPSGALKSGIRIAQAILMEHKWNDVRIMQSAVDKKTDRGDGGFGSTGK